MKIIAVITTCCFLLTSVTARAISAVIDQTSESFVASRILSGPNIPLSAGRITEARYFGSQQVVIDIQDLHCHSEVQKNISKIISALDNRYKVNNVYLEGAYGDVDTSWLTSIKDKFIRQRIVDYLLEKGKLTGAEYYSVASERPRVIKGIENKKLYIGNFARLQKILDSQKRINSILSGLDYYIYQLKDERYNSNQKRLGTIIAQYRSGSISPRKYYGLLKKYSEKYEIDLSCYPDLYAYISLMEKERQLSYKAISFQLQQFISLLKQKLTYTEFKELAGKTNNFQNPEDLYTYLVGFSREAFRQYSSNFPQLYDFFNYISLSKKVNPLNLVQEDERFLAVLRSRLSETDSQKKAAFAADFFRYFKEYFTNQISAEDYEYFTANLEKFRQVWKQYVRNERLSMLDPYMAVFEGFYKTNLKRNGCFVSNIAGSAPAEHFENPDNKGYFDDTREIFKSLASFGHPKVVVAGGFHTEGITKILEKRKISYIVITPVITQDTGKSSEIYEKLAREQSRYLFQSYALLAASLGDKQALLFEANVKLAGDKVSIEDIKREFLKASGGKYRFEAIADSKDVRYFSVDCQTQKPKYEAIYDGPGKLFKVVEKGEYFSLTNRKAMAKRSLIAAGLSTVSLFASLIFLPSLSAMALWAAVTLCLIFAGAFAPLIIGIIAAIKYNHDADWLKEAARRVDEKMSARESLGYTPYDEPNTEADEIAEITSKSRSIDFLLTKSSGPNVRDGVKLVWGPELNGTSVLLQAHPENGTIRVNYPLLVESKGILGKKYLRKIASAVRHDVDHLQGYGEARCSFRDLIDGLIMRVANRREFYTTRIEMTPAFTTNKAAITLYKGYEAGVKKSLHAAHYAKCVDAATVIQTKISLKSKLAVLACALLAIFIPGTIFGVSLGYASVLIKVTGEFSYAVYLSVLALLSIYPLVIGTRSVFKLYKQIGLIISAKKERSKRIKALGTEVFPGDTLGKKIKECEINIMEFEDRLMSAEANRDSELAKFEADSQRKEKLMQVWQPQIDRLEKVIQEEKTKAHNLIDSMAGKKDELKKNKGKEASVSIEILEQREEILKKALDYRVRHENMINDLPAELKKYMTKMKMKLLVDSEMSNGEYGNYRNGCITVDIYALDNRDFASYILGNEIERAEYRKTNSGRTRQPSGFLQDIIFLIRDTYRKRIMDVPASLQPVEEEKVSLDALILQKESAELFPYVEAFIKNKRIDERAIREAVQILGDKLSKENAQLENENNSETAGKGMNVQTGGEGQKDILGELVTEIKANNTEQTQKNLNDKKTEKTVILKNKKYIPRLALLFLPIAFIPHLSLPYLIFAGIMAAIGLISLIKKKNALVAQAEKLLNAHSGGGGFNWKEIKARTLAFVNFNLKRIKKAAISILSVLIILPIIDCVNAIGENLHPLIMPYLQYHATVGLPLDICRTLITFSGLPLPVSMLFPLIALVMIVISILFIFSRIYQAFNSPKVFVNPGINMLPRIGKDISRLPAKTVNMSLNSEDAENELNGVCRISVISNFSVPNPKRPPKLLKNAVFSTEAGMPTYIVTNGKDTENSEDFCSDTVAVDGEPVTVYAKIHIYGKVPVISLSSDKSGLSQELLLGRGALMVAAKIASEKGLQDLLPEDSGFKAGAGRPFIFEMFGNKTELANPKSVIDQYTDNPVLANSFYVYHAGPVPREVSASARAINPEDLANQTAEERPAQDLTHKGIMGSDYIVGPAPKIYENKYSNIIHKLPDSMTSPAEEYKWYRENVYKPGIISKKNANMFYHEIFVSGSPSSLSGRYKIGTVTDLPEFTGKNGIRNMMISNWNEPMLYGKEYGTPVKNFAGYTLTIDVGRVIDRYKFTDIDISGLIADNSQEESLNPSRGEINLEDVEKCDTAVMWQIFNEIINVDAYEDFIKSFDRRSLARDVFGGQIMTQGITAYLSSIEKLYGKNSEEYKKRAEMADEHFDLLADNCLKSTKSISNIVDYENFINGFADRELAAEVFTSLLRKNDVSEYLKYAVRFLGGENDDRYKIRAAMLQGKAAEGKLAEFNEKFVNNAEFDPENAYAYERFISNFNASGLARDAFGAVLLTKDQDFYHDAVWLYSAPQDKSGKAYEKFKQIHDVEDALVKENYEQFMDQVINPKYAWVYEKIAKYNQRLFYDEWFRTFPDRKYRDRCINAKDASELGLCAKMHDDFNIYSLYNYMMQMFYRDQMAEVLEEFHKQEAPKDLRAEDESKEIQTEGKKMYFEMDVSTVYFELSEVIKYLFDMGFDGVKINITGGEERQNPDDFFKIFAHSLESWIRSEKPEGKVFVSFAAGSSAEKNIKAASHFDICRTLSDLDNGVTLNPGDALLIDRKIDKASMDKIWQFQPQDIIIPAPVLFEEKDYPLQNDESAMRVKLSHRFLKDSLVKSDIIQEFSDEITPIFSGRPKDLETLEWDGYAAGIGFPQINEVDEAYWEGINKSGEYKQYTFDTPDLVKKEGVMGLVKAMHNLKFNGRKLSDVLVSDKKCDAVLALVHGVFNNTPGLREEEWPTGWLKLKDYFQKNIENTTGSEKAGYTCELLGFVRGVAERVIECYYTQKEGRIEFESGYDQKAYRSFLTLKTILNIDKNKNDYKVPAELAEKERELVAIADAKSFEDLDATFGDPAHRGAQTLLWRKFISLPNMDAAYVLLFVKAVINFKEIMPYPSDYLLLPKVKDLLTDERTKQILNHTLADIICDGVITSLSKKDAADYAWAVSTLNDLFNDPYLFDRKVSGEPEKSKNNQLINKDAVLRMIEAA